MSLDIIAFDPIETEKIKDKFEEKYNVPFEKFENDMFIPSKDDFFYYLHPQWLENDTKVYKEMRKAAEKYKFLLKLIVSILVMVIFTFLEKNLGNWSVWYTTMKIFLTLLLLMTINLQVLLYLASFSIPIVMVFLPQMMFKIPISNSRIFVIKTSFRIKDLVTGEKK